jgi:Na+/H+-dicarboxylate symporter
MLKVVDRIFGGLLALAACGHTVGTFLWTQPMSGIFIWSLGSSLAAGLLAALNLVRAGRPNDKTLALITMVGTACWALVALGFGISIGNVLDPRLEKPLEQSTRAHSARLMRLLTLCKLTNTHRERRKVIPAGNESTAHP